MTHELNISLQLHVCGEPMLRHNSAAPPAPPPPHPLVSRAWRSSSRDSVCSSEIEFTAFMSFCCPRSAILFHSCGLENSPDSHPSGPDLRATSLKSSQSLGGQIWSFPLKKWSQDCLHSNPKHSAYEAWLTSSLNFLWLCSLTYKMRLIIILPYLGCCEAIGAEIVIHSKPSMSCDLLILGLL